MPQRLWNRESAQRRVLRTRKRRRLIRPPNRDRRSLRGRTHSVEEFVLDRFAGCAALGGQSSNAKNDTHYTCLNCQLAAPQANARPIVALGVT